VGPHGAIVAEPADDTSLGDLHHRTRCSAVVNPAARDHAATTTPLIEPLRVSPVAIEADLW
jgi:hypothetical protein